MGKPDTTPAPSPAVRVLVFLALIALIGVGVWWAVPATGGDSEATPDTSKQAGVAEVGQPAPALAGTTLTGDAFELASHTQKGTWVVFNATWCTSCRSEAPDIEKIAAEDAATVVTVFMGEDAATVQDFVGRVGMTTPTALPDPDKSLARAWGVTGIPAHFFLTPDGIISHRHVGALSLPQIRDYLEDLSQP